MISDRGKSIELGIKNQPPNIIHNWICIECGYKMSTNVHWGKNKGIKPLRCPNCKKYG